jgi:hypothetical protein
MRGEPEDQSHESNCPETTRIPHELETGIGNCKDDDTAAVRMMDELINEAMEAANHHRLKERDGPAHHEQGGSILTQHDFMPIRRDTSLSARQQVNLIQQERQEREVGQRRDMNDFLDRLDKEIDEAIPVGTKNKYKPIQDDFEVVSFIIISQTS